MNSIDASFLDTLNRLIYQWAVYENEVWWLVGLVSGLSLLLAWIIEEQPVIQVPLWFLFAATLCFQPLLYLILLGWSAEHWQQAYEVPDLHLYAYVGGLLLVLAPGLIMLRHVYGTVDNLLNRFTKRTSQQRDGNTDIREINKQLPSQLKGYKVERYINKKDKVFVGLNRSKRPIYIDQQRWRSSHMDIIGTTGSGKGVAAGYLLTQAATQGESLVVIDPKNDEFLPHVMANAAEKAGAPFHFIDLTDTVPQWNPIRDKDSYQIEELLTAGFSLGEGGSDADFYRLTDRKAARVFSRMTSDPGLTLSQRHSVFLTKQKQLASEAKKFVSDLEELCDAPVVQTNLGIDLATALSEGAIIYVKGSMRHPSVLKLQKIFVLSIMQHCENRDRDTARHVCIFLDELKYLISNPALQALGTIRDKRAHVLLAHQSLGDLRDCPKDMDADSVVASINENCSLKLTYKVNDPDTAEWLAKMSGKILVDDEIRTFSRSRALSEVSERERSLRQTERYLIDTNMLQSLPSRCAVLFGNGLADYTFTSPIKVSKTSKNTTPSSFEAYQHTATPSSVEDLLDVD